MKRLPWWTIPGVLLSVWACKQPAGLTRGESTFPLPWDNTAPVTVVSVTTYSAYLGVQPQSDRFFDLDTTQPDVQDRVLIVFSGPVDEASLVGGLHLEAVAGNQSGAIPATVMYEAETHRAWLIPAQPLRDSTAYVLTVAETVHDAAGNPIDGNGNGAVDGALDAVRRLLWGPPGPGGGDPVYTLDQEGPRIRNVWTFTVNPWSGAGNLLAADTLYVQFRRLDLDPATLSGAVFFRTYPGAQPAGNVQFVRLDTVGNRVNAVFTYSGLAYASLYELILTPDVKDTAGNPLDGNDNGRLEVRDTFRLRFTTALDSTGIPAPYPWLIQSTRVQRQITLRFSEPMDTTSLTSTTLQLFVQTAQGTYPLPYRTLWAPDRRSVEVRFSLPDSRWTVIGYTLFLSHQVRSAQGLPLDGNMDGMGGDPARDDLWINL